MRPMKEIIERLKDVVNIQKMMGNWDFDPYMHGMANGLILAQAILKDQDPKFLDAPKVWRSDKSVRPILEKFARHMEKKLRENDYKDGWQSDTIRSLIDRVREETIELSNAAMAPANLEDIQGEAIDVANFAMMIFDNAEEEKQ